jgi:cytochrome c oxidase subunit 2
MLAFGYAWWLPPDASEHGGAIDNLIVMVHWFMAVLFVGWGFYFVYCLARFRDRPGHLASTKLPKAKASKVAEVAVIIVETILLLGFSIPIWAQNRGAAHVPRADEALVVRVVAEQFAWNVHYPGSDGKFGGTDPGLMTKENPVGLDRENDAAAKDDIVTINQLHVPVGRQVVVHVSSKDVIHGFNLPFLRVKQDAIPGMQTAVWFKALKTTDQVRDEMTNTYPARVEFMPVLKNHITMADAKGADGSVVVEKYTPITAEILEKLTAAGVATVEASPAVPTEIACAQLCGLSHYRMRGYLNIDTPEQFEAWKAKEEEWLTGEDDEEY